MLFKPKTRKVLLSLILAGTTLGAVLIGYAILTINARKAELAEIIRANPATTSVVAYTIDARGQLVEDGRSLFINADTPLVMASTIKVVVLLAYEQAVAQGELDPGELVPVAELETFYLPKTDGGAHAAGLASLGLSADEFGFASDAQARLALEDIARIMIHYSGNAETDYLITRLGDSQIAAAIQAAGFEHHSRIFPTLGVTLAMVNHEDPLVSVEQQPELQQAIAGQDFTFMENLINRYLQDPDWRAAQIAWMKSDAFDTAVAQLDWNAQLQVGLLFPQGTAREYARLMAQIASGSLVSPEISARMGQKLENIPTDGLLRLLFHRRYGAKDGLTAGVMTLVSYAVPRRGPLAGQTRVVVILTNDLPPAAWSAQVQAQGIYLLGVDLAQATGVFDRLTGGRE